MRINQWKPTTRVQIVRPDGLRHDHRQAMAQGFTTQLAPTRIAGILKIEVALDDGSKRMFLPQLVSFVRLQQVWHENS
jgi:hypothetical protein